MLSEIFNYDISSTFDLLIIALLYTIYEYVKYRKKKSDVNRYRQEVKAELDEIKTRIEATEKKVQGIEFVDVVKSFPNEHGLIDHLYNECKEHNINSYVDLIYNGNLKSRTKKPRRRKNESN